MHVLYSEKLTAEACESLAMRNIKTSHSCAPAAEDMLSEPSARLSITRIAHVLVLGYAGIWRSDRPNKRQWTATFFDQAQGFSHSLRANFSGAEDERDCPKILSGRWMVSLNDGFSAPLERSDVMACNPPRSQARMQLQL